MRITRNRDLGDEAPELAAQDRLWLLMDIAIGRHEHALSTANATDDPFWIEMARLSGTAADRAIAAYDAAKGGE